MMMRRHGWVFAWAAICSLAACGGDDGDGSAGSAGSGGSGGNAGSSGASGSSGDGGGGACRLEGGPNACINIEPDDISCPDGVGPYDGSCGPKTGCCQRSSNNAKIAQLCPDDPMTLEYRITSAQVMNHPLSTSLPVLLDAANQRARTCAGDQCLLLRFEQPRMGGAPVAGPGKASTAIGRYNCDGTYSYYNDTVAPSRPAEGFTDPARWNVVTADTTVDPAVEGPGRNKIAWATNPNQRVSTNPFFLPGTQTVDWEVATSGFEILQFDTSEAGRDCQGRWDGARWETTGRYQTFAPLAHNNKDVIDSLTQNFCQLLSFSVLPMDARDTDCLAVPRCMPGTDGCRYVKLPDSLCPEDDQQRGIFRCHLGALGNPNNEDGYPDDLNCTMEAPTTPLNPDVDPNVSKGQCCDPLGADTNGLPACNAFRIINQFAAAAAEITTEPASTFPPTCM